MENISNRLDNYIRELEELLNKEPISEENRRELSTKIQGFIRATSGESRVKDYLQEINIDVSQGSMIPREIRKKTLNMKRFLLGLKEEVEVKEFLNLKEPKGIDEVIDKAGKEKDEAERRKNVAEMKYWGFAIELLETVRNQLKSHDKLQEELLENIKELLKEIKEQKKLEDKK